MTVMAGKKPKKYQRLGKPLHVWIDGALRDAVDIAVERSRPRASLKAIVEVALEDYLKGVGLWPPLPDADAD